MPYCYHCNSWLFYLPFFRREPCVRLSLFLWLYYEYCYYCCVLHVYVLCTLVIPIVPVLSFSTLEFGEVGASMICPVPDLDMLWPGYWPAVSNAVVGAYAFPPLTGLLTWSWIEDLVCVVAVITVPPGYSMVWSLPGYLINTVYSGWVYVLHYYYWYITAVRVSVRSVVESVSMEGIPAVAALQV